jgi:hypothetical protein
MIEPESEQSVEEAVLSQTTSNRIVAGPSGPPTGPTGPPAAGPTGPPSGPTGPPESVSVETVEAAAEVVEEQNEPVGDVYEDQGDGWFFRKFPDGSYDQTVYVVEEGQYVPYVEPEV